jgi:adenylate cyclase
MVDINTQINKTHYGLNSLTPKTKKLQKTFFYIIYVVLAGLLVVGIFFIQNNKSTDIFSQTKWQNSISVLPFRNISGDPNQDWFCDGLTEQLITNLTRLQKLKVSAQTSVMKFKNTRKTTPEIGNELNVNHVLESSVRKYGNQIRVTARLMNTKDGFLVWANEYDRDLEDVIKVLDDICQSISNTVLKRLSSDELRIVETKQSKDVKAYQYYMKGRKFKDDKFSATFSQESFNLSVSMFEKAIEIDPNYALAYAGLADIYNTYFNFVVLSKEERAKTLGLQQKNIKKALNLNPYLSEIHRINGYVYGAAGDINNEYKCLKTALKMNPNDAQIQFALGVFLRKRGLFHQSLKYYTKALELDPLNPYHYMVRSICYNVIGEFDNAIIDIQEALMLEPDHVLSLVVYASLLIELKKVDEARSLLERCEQAKPNFRLNNTLRALLFAVEGEKDKALAIPTDLLNRILIYTFLGMKDKAIYSLKELTERDKDQSTSSYLNIKNSPIFNDLHDDNRFKAILTSQKTMYEDISNQYKE